MSSHLLSTQQHTALSHILRHKATTQPDKLAFTYLDDGISPSQTLTYKALHDQAQAIAEHLRDCSQPGKRALLMFPPGLEFISAFFGCLYAGIIAVPTPELDPVRAKRSRPRLRSIAQDSQASILLTTKKLFASGEEPLDELAEIVSMTRMFVEESFHNHLAKGSERDIDHRNDIAFLQYTSGSTSSPKGVIVTQQCLLQQLNALTRTCGLQDESIALNWMPHFHDSGLVSGLLLNVYLGIPTYVMSPTRFLRNPLVWLQAITKYHVTHSSGPNFAYDLCVTKTEPQERAGLNLSEWSFATCGAEPIRVETMEDFTRTFEPLGLPNTPFPPLMDWQNLRWQQQ